MSLTEEIIAKKFAECSKDPSVLMKTSADLIEEGVKEIVQEFNAVHEGAFQVLKREYEHNVHILALNPEARPMTRGGFLRFPTEIVQCNAIAISIEDYSKPKRSFRLSSAYPDVGIAFMPNNTFKTVFWQWNKNDGLEKGQLHSYTGVGRFGAPTMPLNASQVREALENFTNLLPWNSVDVDRHVRQKPEYTGIMKNHM